MVFRSPLGLRLDYRMIAIVLLALGISQPTFSQVIPSPALLKAFRLLEAQEYEQARPILEAEVQAGDAVAAFNSFNQMAEQRIEAQKAKQAEELDKVSAGFQQTDSGLRYQIIQEGAGQQADAGQTVSVHYKGQLLDGTVFDSSYKRQQPIDFVLGQGQVIPGWDEGVSLLKVGDKARFVIPSNLAYGSRGAGGVIPPDAVLIFDVELVAVS